MMAAVPLSSACLLPLLECLEDASAGLSEQTDAYITIANRLNGEEGRQFLPVVVKHFARLCKVLLVHISSENEELCQAALQALGFCVFHSHIVSVIPANDSEEILSTLCNVVVQSKEKFTCTRALWVISKQNFPPEVVAKKAPEILKSLEAMQTREVQSILIDHESLNVIIRLLEQAPPQMAAGAVCWAKLVVPLVVHSANKVRLRAAAALELGMPLLLEKQQEVAAIVEPMMSSTLIPEMQKLFASKNETNMLKLWPLFVRLLGKLLHKGGAFINSLLYLEELGFRSSSPNIKKIAFIAWKSLIDNFALNPDILCSSKRLKLLMQPLSSIHVRTEALLLTKLEVWWYLTVKLGPNLAANFEQVGIPLLHSTLPPDSPLQSPATPARTPNSSNGTPNTPKSGIPSCSSLNAAPHMNLNSSMQVAQSYRSIQLLGLEMLLQWLLGPEVTSTAAKENLQLSLEPLTHPLLTSPSTFSRHASTLISAVRDGFIAVGKHASDALYNLIWSNLIGFVSATIEAGNKKERQGSEVLTFLLKALQSILSSDVQPPERALLLLEVTVRGIPQKVLGSAAYQVANMDVLNGTPALFLILLFYNISQLSSFLEDERFFSSLEALVSCGFCGHTSPLAFGEAVLRAVSGSVEAVKNKQQLCRMWSMVVTPLTDTITQTNEVNQGDSLEHNFSAIHSALMFPIIHLMPSSALPQTTQKTMINMWSKLYKAFARCSALVATAEENVCCEELCAKISASLDGDALKSLSMLDAIANILLIIIESMDFSPYTPQFQQKMKSPRTPLSWVRKRSKALGNFSTFHSLLMKTLEAFLALDPSEASAEPTDGLGLTIITILSIIFTNITLPTFIQEVLSTISKPLAQFFKQFSSFDEESKHSAAPGPKLDKLAADLLGCLQMHSTLHNDELLAVLSPLLCVLFPHKSKQIRTVVTHFWNATFGNALTLTYPEALRAVLSQAKQKTPLILPGFEAVDAPDDCSGPYSVHSSESSQLDPQLSGIKVTSVGMRDSLLARAEDLKGRSSVAVTKPVSVKLDFGSPKPLRCEAIEEAASVDFVFIPPETKERVLTEHQKEVKRTKRVDIPALYNNLDASLDTIVFTQYSQSQEESMEKLTTVQIDQLKEEDKVQLKVATIEDPTTDVKLTQDGTGSDIEIPEKAALNKNQTSEKIQSPSSNVSMNDVSGHEKSGLEETSPNVSSSSDMITGTPPQPNSRRQSFITLEKYVEGKPASPTGVTFTGPFTRKSNRLDALKALQSTPNASLESQPQIIQDNSQKSEKISNTELSTQNEEESMEAKDEIKSTSSHPCEGTDEEEDDLVPDTQTQVSNEVLEIKNPPVAKASETRSMESEKASPEEDSQTLPCSPPTDLNSSQEPRRSGRRRSRPLRPGEDPVELKSELQEKNQVAELKNAQKPTLAPIKSTNSPLAGRSRSKILDEGKAEDDQLKNKGVKGERGQTDSQISSAEFSQALSQEMGMCGKTETESSHKRSPVTRSDSQTKERLSPLSEPESLSAGRPMRKTRKSNANLEGFKDKKEPDEKSQNNSQNAASASKKTFTHTPVSEIEADGQKIGRLRRTRRSAASEVVEMTVSKTNDKPATDEQKGQDLSETDSQTLTVVHSRSLIRKNTEEDKNFSGDVTSTVSMNAEHSQTEDFSGTPDSSQERSRYRTRRLSKGLLASSDNTVSENSDSREDGPKPKKRPRKPQPTEVLLKDPEMVLDKEDVNSRSEVSMETSMSQDGPDPEPTLETSFSDTKELEQKDEEEVPATENVMQEQSQTDTKLRIERDAEENDVTCTSIIQKAEGGEMKPSSQNCPLVTEVSSQGQSRYRTRRLSKGLLASTDNIKSDNSDNREDGPRLKKRPRHPQTTEVLLKDPEMVLDKEDVNARSEDSVETSMSQDGPDPKPSLEISVSDTKDLEQKDEEEVPATENVIEIQEQSQTDTELRMERDAEKKDNVCTSISQKAASEGTKSFSQNSPLVTDDFKVKTEVLHKCPHIRGRGRGRRRSRNCNCFGNRGLFSQDIDSKESQDLNNEPIPLDTNALISQSEQFSPTTASDGNKCTAVVKPDADMQSSSALPDQVLSEVLSSESPITKLGVIVSQLSEAEEGPNQELSKPLDNSNKELVEVQEVRTNELEDLGCGGSQKDQEGEDSSENASVSQELLQSSTPQDTSPSKGHPVEDAPICQEQLESAHVQPEDAVMLAVNENKDLMFPDESKELILSEKSNEAQILDKDAPLVEKEDTQDVLAGVQETSDALKESSVPPQSKVCLDSPPKPKPLDSFSVELEPGQSPSRSRTCVWSPSASPSTSILKKGQKRACDEDTPSPLLKSRRVSFATPIYHQELADDIDRRSPVIHTSSPRSKVLSGQSKYITTPTKGSTLSPRNLRSPGYKSSKKCLISEMSQEPLPIAKDCVFPALVGCSTPVEAVLPQISSNMWPRGFGQLVRARNIKTVGDLSALTPNEIKSLPIRSPKLSNVRKALKTYHEQQRKGRSDELKSFDEMEKMTSEPEEIELSQNNEERTPGEMPEAQDENPSEEAVDLGQMAEERKTNDLLIDVVDLGGRLSSEELSRYSPNQLGLMHEHLSGMMRSIVTQLQSRLLNNLDDSLP
ncbi:telomere-associated protein RIF1-like isoform X2 [Myxocyprinus asiaticus]|uniref:telomere-associated protein RIF1-like isoform X2 n=1 Tax=Myxocyprinus asiaticus TaxID=70543 RepID=UPI002223C284|nr:telomere-associated protein RIF1-like isoform X2 [Myxocyprinus asiaticus]